MNKMVVRKNNGFTLAETLAAILIMSLVGLIIVGGFTTFMNSYKKIQQVSNAQILASQVELQVRDELKYATDIIWETSSNKVTEFVDGDTGTTRKFEFISNTKQLVIIDELGEVPVVSSAMKPDGIYAKISDITYDASKQLFTVGDDSSAAVTVYDRNDNVLAKIDVIKVRNLNGLQGD